MRRRRSEGTGDSIDGPLQHCGDGLVARSTVECRSDGRAQAQAVQEQCLHGQVQARAMAEAQQQFATGADVFQQRTAFDHRRGEGTAEALRA